MLRTVEKGVALSQRRVDKRHVLLLIDHLDIGGAQTHIAVLAKRLTVGGHPVVVAHTGPARVRLDPSISVVQLMRERISRSDSPSFRLRALQLARRLKPGLVHGHLFASALAGGSIAGELGLPLVLSHHSSGTWQTESDRSLLAAPIALANHHFTASEEIRQRLLALGVDPCKAEFLPNAVPLPDRALARRAPAEGLRIGFLARFTADKDPLLLLQAMAKLRDRHVPAQLLMRGGGELADQIYAAVRGLDLENRVVVGGSIRDPRRLYSRVDVLCLPSRSEGMPLVVLEAMGHELPVVATRVGSVPLEVQEGVTGLLCEPGDAGTLADQLEWMWRHPIERLRMGAAARQHVTRYFSLSVMVKRVEAVYTALMVGLSGASARGHGEAGRTNQTS
jgi:glycosyltransferase involved in cell wall biosynthesis